MFFTATAPYLAQAKFEDSCPDWLKKPLVEAPECPSGATMVPETYPHAAVVVSDVPSNGAREAFKFHAASSFAMSFVEKVLLASGDQPPLMLLSVRKSTYLQIVRRVKELAGDDPRRAEWVKALRKMEGEPFLWQQDYFESFVGQDGRPILREVGGYKNRGSMPNNLFGGLAAALKGCGIGQSLPLEPTEPFDFIGGQSGGNIEVLPGGICLLGTDYFPSGGHWKKYAEEVCGANQVLQVPTSWLHVGHTDEVVKVLPGSGPAPCNFSVAVASPRRALELLGKNPKEKFLDFSGTPFESKEWVTRRRVGEAAGLKLLCDDELPNYSRALPQKDEPVPAAPVRPSRDATWLEKILAVPIPEARGDPDVNLWKQMKRNTPHPCEGLTNERLLRMLSDKDSHLGQYNRLVQTEMDGLRAKLAATLKGKFPQCTPNFVEVPQLFVGEMVKNETGFTLTNRSGVSLLPNPINAVVVRKTMMVPDPGNEAFRRDIRASYAAVGAKTEFLDVFDISHYLGGNIHCITHAVPICRPAAAREKN